MRTLVYALAVITSVACAPRITSKFPGDDAPGGDAAAAAAAVPAAAPSGPGAPAALSKYNVDPAQISVSGISAGGAMAAQLHVAHSATFRKGALLMAPPPYRCAQGAMATALGPCMNSSEGFCFLGMCFGASKPDTSKMIADAKGYAAKQQIDPLSHLASSKVHIERGALDSVAKGPTTAENAPFYKGVGVPAANIKVVTTPNLEHAVATDFFGASCPTKGSPWINNCNYDQVGAGLSWLHDGLAPRNDGPLTGQFVEFDQREFAGSATSFADVGYAYVPASCAPGSSTPCRLHLALHGCKQSTSWVGDAFLKNSGHVRWADSNGIIVLFPQAKDTASNPAGCWDWWGYEGDPNEYATKAGRQVQAMKRMVDRAAGL